MKFLLIVFGVACVVIALAAIFSGHLEVLFLGIPGIISLGASFK